VELEFVHPYGEGKVSPAPVSGRRVLFVSAKIPLGRLEVGYSEGKVRRLHDDANGIQRKMTLKGL
jgi:hypothetical protein